MIRQEQLSQWLGDRQRKYADGLVLFGILAKESMKKKYAAYLDTAPESPHILTRISPSLSIACRKLTRKSNILLHYILPLLRKLPWLGP